MIESRPSRTAERVAIRRAAHQLLDEPRVHDDPLALAILGDAQAVGMRADPRRFEDGLVAPVLRAFLAVRSRLAEDALAQAVGAGVLGRSDARHGLPRGPRHGARRAKRELLFKSGGRAAGW